MSDLKIDLDKSAEDGVNRAVRQEQERLWRQDNAEAISASNRYVEGNSLPFGNQRPF